MLTVNDQLNYLIWLRDRGLSSLPPAQHLSPDHPKVLASNCHKCPISSQRIFPIWGQKSGNSCQVLFLSDYPPLDHNGQVLAPEDHELLEKMQQAIGLSPNNSFCCNLILCPVSHDCINKEAYFNACAFFREWQLKSINPPYLLLLGEKVVKTLYPEKAEPFFEKSVGTWLDHPLFPDSQVMPIYHPREMRQNSNLKRPTWIGLQKLAQHLQK